MIQAPNNLSLNFKRKKSSVLTLALFFVAIFVIGLSLLVLPTEFAQASRARTIKAGAEAATEQAQGWRARFRGLFSRNAAENSENLPTLANKTDTLYKSTNGMLSDFSSRVRNSEFLPTIGRQQEIEQVKGAFNSSDIVLLSGREGVGKTQIVTSLADKFNIIEVNIDTRAFSSIEDFEVFLRKVSEDIGDDVMYFFPKSHRFVAERTAGGVPLDEYLEVIHRVHNRRAKVLVEGITEQVANLRSAATRLSRAAEVKVKFLSSQQIKQVVSAYARSLEREMPNVHFSDEIIEKAIEMGFLHYPDLGRPMGAIHLIQASAGLKVQRYESRFSPFSKVLRDRKAELKSQYDEALSLNGLYAQQRRSEIPGELQELNQKIIKADQSFTQLRELRKRSNTLKKKKRLTRQEAEELVQIKKEIEQVNIEDLALQIHYERGIPIEELVRSSEALTIAQKIELYKRVLFGQDEAIEAIVRATSRSGPGATIRTDEKPLGSFLFLGPTGVGKTEAVLTAGKIEGRNVIRKDMSEYSNKAAETDLIGASQQYIGHGSRNFVDDVADDPRAFVLLDEIEKAAFEVFNLLLQVLDTGRLTSKTGRVAQFKDTFVAMTTNLLHSAPEGATRKEIIELLIKTAAERGERLAPEFLGRIKHFIFFRPMDEQMLLSILEREMNSLNEVLSQSLIKVEVSWDLKNQIVRHVADNTQGSGRDLVNQFKLEVNEAMEQILNFGTYRAKNGDSIEVPIQRGDLVHVDYDETLGVVFNIATH